MNSQYGLLPIHHFDDELERKGKMKNVNICCRRIKLMK